jgi:hypothetical protein
MENGVIVPELPFYGRVLEDDGLLGIDWSKTTLDAIPSRCPWCGAVFCRGTHCPSCGRRYVVSVRHYLRMITLTDAKVQQLRAKSRERRERTRKKERAHEQ